MISFFLTLSQVFFISGSATDLNLVSNFNMTKQECYDTSDVGGGREPISCARLLYMNLRKVCTDIQVDAVDPYTSLKEKSEFKATSSDCKILELNNGSCPSGFEPKPSPSKIPERFTICKGSSSAAEDPPEKTNQKSLSR